MQKANLNTSHVEVKGWLTIVMIVFRMDLNTSHVEVKGS